MQVKTQYQLLLSLNMLLKIPCKIILSNLLNFVIRKISWIYLGAFIIN
jgi:hypothetical protein